jgi:hypothetical protein
VVSGLRRFIAATNCNEVSVVMRFCEMSRNAGHRRDASLSIRATSFVRAGSNVSVNRTSVAALA